MARVRALIVTTSLVVVAGLGPISPFAAGSAGAAGAHRALVIVDTGATTFQRVITFDADSITGIQALDLAGASPVVYTFSGQGGAVCRLFGVGRDAGPNCLGGADGDNRYWAYFRAPAGTSSFTYSRAGGGTTQVHDGDVEGWKFGTGQAPAWSPLPAPTTTTTTPPLPPVTSPPGGTGAAPTGSGGGTGAAPAGPPAGASPEQAAAYWAALAASGTTMPPTSPRDATAVRGASTARADSNRSTRRVASSSAALGTDGSSGTTGWGSIIGFAAAAAAIVGIGLYLRRMRSRPIP